jgi:hypothetical protein
MISSALVSAVNEHQTSEVWNTTKHAFGKCRAIQN